MIHNFGEESQALNEVFVNQVVLSTLVMSKNALPNFKFSFNSDEKPDDKTPIKLEYALKDFRKLTDEVEIKRLFQFAAYDKIKRLF